MTAQALAGIKVLEYGDFISAPYCSKLLGDMGANVIKIEKPGLGDTARSWGPFPQDLPHPEKSGLFLFLNTSKMGITLNVESAAGRKIFRNLAGWADVLVENNAPAEMDRLGFDYESLSRKNPALIVTSITPFGQTGPYRNYRGSALVNCYLAGIAYSNPAEGVEDIEHHAPLKTPVHSAEFMGAPGAAAGTMSAIIARQRSGKGQHVDMSLQEAIASVGRTNISMYTVDGAEANRDRAMRARAAGVLFACRDGHVCMWMGPFWASLIKMIGNPDWASREPFNNPATRSRHSSECIKLIEEWTGQRTAAEVNKAAVVAGVPCSPVRTVKDVVEDEQLASRHYFTEIDHPVAGKIKYPGAPYKLSGTPWEVTRPAPLLGQHNEDVYCGLLGYKRADLVRMRQSGII
jgi:crotonobetainyl-CoA:carnitine CoA-transferase CaiB-like acyl-CoA transferase